MDTLDVLKKDRTGSGLFKLVRKPHLAEKIVFIDGLPGCGKTLFARIVAALPRVEKLTYPYDIEFICSAKYLQKLEDDVAITMIRMLTDLYLDNLMMARETNFRPADLSSVFRDAKPFRYVRRFFQKGDAAVPERVKRERPILHLATHQLLMASEPIFAALGDRIFFIEIVRHPLYMIKQQSLNMKRLLQHVRDFTIYFSYNNTQLPYFAFGWEELFLNSNDVEKSIYFMDKLTTKSEMAKKSLIEKYNAKILTIPFEPFVINPWLYMGQIEHFLGTNATATTRRVMKQQNVPRKLYAEGIGLKIYKHCDWKAPERGSNEEREFEIRRQFAREQASPEAMRVLDRISSDYEEKYLSCIKKDGERYE